MEKKGYTFKIPKTIKYRETRKLISDLVRTLNEQGLLSATDMPQLHRMATAYDHYLECVEIIAREGLIMENLKGEIVKRPEANLIRECWNQYLEIAKEYGLTTKSKGQIKMLKESSDGGTPADDFFKRKKTE